MKNKQDILKLHPMIGRLTPMQWDEIHKAMDAYLNEYKAEQLTLTDVSKRYDANKYTPPFRVGRKQGKAVLDGKGIEVVFFNNSEEQASKYCDYLNGC